MAALCVTHLPTCLRYAPCTGVFQGPGAPPPPQADPGSAGGAAAEAPQPRAAGGAAAAHQAAHAAAPARVHLRGKDLPVEELQPDEGGGGGGGHKRRRGLGVEGGAFIYPYCTPCFDNIYKDVTQTEH